MGIGLDMRYMNVNILNMKEIKQPDSIEVTIFYWVVTLILLGAMVYGMMN